MGVWGAKKNFRSAGHAETARAFEREYASRFQPWGVELLVVPTRRGLLRESGEGAWLDLGKEGMWLDATFVLAERHGNRWVEVTSPSDFARQLREAAEDFLLFLADKADPSGKHADNEA